MGINSKEVFILKAQTENEEENLYSKMIRDADFNVKTIPVLDFEYCNLQKLKECLEKPEDYSGIIFSSPRSVKAVRKCIGLSGNLSSKWQRLPMFVVGETTKKILMTELNLRGECGVTENAVGLADLIVQSTFHQPLLFPCSNIRRDTLPSLLSGKGVPLREVNVYCTQPNPALEEILRQMTNEGKNFPEFMVFFSPSGVEHTLPLFSLLNAPLADIKMVAIGKTTLSALKDANVDVWSCALKPSPQYLLNALLQKS